MDFLKRDEQAEHVAAHQAAGVPGPHTPRRKKLRESKLLRFATVTLLISGTILVVAMLVSLAIGGPKNEVKYVDDSKLQAVFLNGGQVYFGDITDLNSRFMRLSNIYYLRVNQTVQPKDASKATNNDISLVKLGCELHGPQDSMVINREQVIFWENLKGDGQVAKAVATFVKQNPNGQQCTTTNNTSTNSTNNTNSTP